MQDWALHRNGSPQVGVSQQWLPERAPKSREEKSLELLCLPQEGGLLAPSGPALCSTGIREAWEEDQGA